MSHWPETRTYKHANTDDTIIICKWAEGRPLGNFGRFGPKSKILSICAYVWLITITIWDYDECDIEYGWKFLDENNFWIKK